MTTQPCLSERLLASMTQQGTYDTAYDNLQTALSLFRKDLPPDKIEVCKRVLNIAKDHLLQAYLNLQTTEKNNVR